MTTIKLSDGDLGLEVMMVRCDLSQASAPVQVEGGGKWVGTQYQCADARHTTEGLIEIAKELAAAAVEVPPSKFQCEAEEI